MSINCSKLSSLLSSKTTFAAVFMFLATILASPAMAAGSAPEFDSVQFIRYNGTIYISGFVDDDDDDVEGFEVTIDGDIYGTAYVDENGYFSAEIPEPWTSGSVFVYIEVKDPAGNSDTDGEWLY